MQKTGLFVVAPTRMVVEKQKDDALVAAFSKISSTELRSL